MEITIQKNADKSEENILNPGVCVIIILSNRR